MPTSIDPLLYMTVEQFAWLNGLAGIACGLILAWVFISNT
jgi:hypothetical protein